MVGRDVPCIENEASIKALGPDPVQEPGYVPEAPRVAENPAPVEGVPSKLGEGFVNVVSPILLGPATEPTE